MTESYHSDDPSCDGIGTAVRRRPLRSNRLQRSGLAGGRFDMDRVAFADATRLHDHGHDPGLAHHAAPTIARTRGRHQPRPHAVQLTAGIAQPGHLEADGVPDVQPRAARPPVVTFSPISAGPMSKP